MDLNFRNKTNQEVVNHLSKSLKEEKIISDHILFILEEIENRRIYAELGYPSLFEMLVKKFYLSESSAYTRISSMRLIKSVPAAKVALINHQLNLSTLTQVQTFIKREDKIRGRNSDSNRRGKMTFEEKTALIEKVKGKTQQQVKRELALLNPTFAVIKQQEKILNEDETQVAIVMDQELMQKLQKVRAIISHQNPNPTYQELLHIMADKMLTQASKVKTQTSGKVCVIKSSKNTKDNKQIKRTRHIPNHIQRLIWQRDQGRCQYQKPDGDICGSQYFLQMDHIKPFSQKGEHSQENLQLLCATHNQYRWKKINYFTSA